jgi:HK97 family phage prohead protease
MDRKHKALTGLKITDATKGEVEAIFATLDVKDSDGDVTLKGAFEDGAEVRISAYNHKSWDGALPVGKGTITETGDIAVLKGQFFLDTTAGADTFEVVKQLGELQEWSYGYDVVDSEKGTKDGESVRYLKSLKVHEVSPVILGAGVDTRTLAVKGAKQLQSDLREDLQEAGEERFNSGGGEQNRVYVADFDTDNGFVIYEVWDGTDWDLYSVSYSQTDDEITLGEQLIEVERVTTYTPKSGQTLQFKRHIEAVKSAVDGLSTRVADVKALRAKEGKGLGNGSKELLAEVESSLTSLQEVLTPEADPQNTEAESLAHEYLRFAAQSI